MLMGIKQIFGIDILCEKYRFRCDENRKTRAFFMCCTKNVRNRCRLSLDYIQRAWALKDVFANFTTKETFERKYIMIVI